MRKKTKELFFLYLVKTVDREEKIGYNKCKYGKGAEDPPPRRLYLILARLSRKSPTIAYIYIIRNAL